MTDAPPPPWELRARRYYHCTDDRYLLSVEVMKPGGTSLRVEVPEPVTAADLAAALRTLADDLKR
jgi:hypothetical protein